MGRKDQQRRAHSPRWPFGVIVAGVLVALGGLLMARYIADRRFLYGLLVVGAGLALSASGFLAHLVVRRLWQPGFTGPAAAALGIAAALGRFVLIWTHPEKTSLPRVVMSREIFLGAPPLLALLGLVLGAHVVYRSLSLPQGGLSQRGRKTDLIASLVALAAALYTLGPLFLTLGVPLNHWTFLGLVGLGLAAFLVATILERILGR